MASALSALASGVAIPPAVAQEEGTVLEGVVVTAQRREQDLQDVPISLDVVGGADIEAQGFRDLTQMASFVPSLQIDAGEQNSQGIRIRGVGSQSNNLALEQSVSMFIDGVHYGRGSSVFSAFLDVDRVEILRGPQPVYFGQNAAAGAISVVSRKPTDTWEGYVSSEVGNNSIMMGEIGVGGPLSDNWGIRFAGKYDASDGFLTDLVKDRKYPAREAYASRITLEYDPGSQFKATAKVEYSDVEKDGDGRIPVGLVARNDRTLGAALTGDFNAVDIAGLAAAHNLGGIGEYGVENSGPWYKLPLTVFEGIGAPPTQGMADLSQIANRLPVGPFSVAKQLSTYIDLEYTFANDIVLSSQTAYSDLDREFARDGQGIGPFLIVGNDRIEQQAQWSQEIRLTSPTGGFFEWMTGLYWEDIELDVGATSYRANVDSLTNPRSNISGNRHHEDDRWLSAFGAVTFNLSDSWAVDLGARYSDVHKTGIVKGIQGFWLDANGNIITGRAGHGVTAVAHTPIAFTGRQTADTFDDSRVNPQVVLRWSPTANVSTYVKYASAMKAGGFDGSVTNVVDPRAYVYDSEFSENYEIGLKGKLFNGRADYAITLFSNEFKDMQLTSFNELLGASSTTNVAKQRVQGAEFDGRFAASDQLSFRLAGSLMDGEMISYPGANCTQDEIARNVCTGAGGTIDRSGADALYTPTWSFALGTDYWLPIGESYKLSFNANLALSDGYLLDFDEMFIMEKSEDLNLSIGFGERDDKWKVTAWARNITEPKPKYQPQFDHDQETEVIILSANNFMTFGLKFGYKF
ncbi:MAG TPA: TonB-dependent receptor [Steroidobacteraceae bacterium]|nr:TonB-dependent receptor [Steroidobacteraceae bacterium]